MFRVYKPKTAARVRAVQVLPDTLQEICGNLMGRIVREDVQTDAGVVPTTLGVDVPTFDGAMRFEMGAWILRDGSNTLTKMSAEEFENTYEVARNTTGM